MATLRGDGHLGDGRRHRRDASRSTKPQAATGGVTGFATQNGGTTGGAGGATVRATTGTAIHTALCTRASSSTPIIIQVSGTINHGNTAKVSGDSCNTAAGVIELKEISNVTIIGVGGGAIFDQLGIHIRDSSNIIIQNVTVRNVKKSGSPTSNGGDAIGMESTRPQRLGRPRHPGGVGRRGGGLRRPLRHEGRRRST